MSDERAERAGPPAGTDLTTRPLSADTWDAFAALVDAANGVWGGCWCLGFHEGASTGTYEGNREAKRARVESERFHQTLVFDGETCVGWCQYGRPDEISRIKNPGKYAAELDRLPDWRIGCIFTGSKHRGRGVATVAVGATLQAIAEAGGGLVEAYPEQQEGRPPQRGAYFQTGTESLYAGHGFVRHRRIAKWRWVMRLDVAPADAPPATAG